MIIFLLVVMTCIIVWPKCGLRIVRLLLVLRIPIIVVIHGGIGLLIWKMLEKITDY